MNWKQKLIRLWNIWPPFLGSGIWVQYISPDFKKIEVVLKMRPWTSNIVGTQFGGSLFAMTDPFYMVMLMQTLGSKYIVWDKSANIRYLKPGRTEVKAIFELSEQILNEIKEKVEAQGKINWEVVVDIKNPQGELIAQVDKVIHIRKK